MNEEQQHSGKFFYLFIHSMLQSPKFAVDFNHAWHLNTFNHNYKREQETRFLPFRRNAQISS